MNIIWFVRFALPWCLWLLNMGFREFVHTDTHMNWWKEIHASSHLVQLLHIVCAIWHCHVHWHLHLYRPRKVWLWVIMLIIIHRIHVNLIRYIWIHIQEQILMIRELLSHWNLSSISYQSKSLLYQNILHSIFQ